MWLTIALLGLIRAPCVEQVKKGMLHAFLIKHAFRSASLFLIRENDSKYHHFSIILGSHLILLLIIY